MVERSSEGLALLKDLEQQVWQEHWSQEQENWPLSPALSYPHLSASVAKINMDDAFSKTLPWYRAGVRKPFLSRAKE